MKDLEPSSFTMWRHLLWKDWRQVWPIVIAIVVVQAMLQLLMGTLEVLLPFQMQQLSSASINVALSSPALLAIACCGLLIGHERQSGCWAWSSSLPISWQQSMFSKFIIWSLSSVVAVAVLLGVSGIALAMNYRTLAQTLMADEQNDLLSSSLLLTVIIGIQVFIYFSIAALLIKDTLMAFVVAAAGLFAFHVIAQALHIEGVVRQVYSESTFLNTMLALYIGSYIVGGIWLGYVYRWRWNAGQYAPIPFFGRTSSVGFARPPRIAWQSFAHSATQPSEFWMLLRHGLRSAMGLRIAVIVPSVFFIAASASGGEMASSLFFLCLASSILGVSVFSGDQTSNRFRFMADRGVSWKKLLLGHVLPPAVAIVGLYLVAVIASIGSLPGMLTGRGLFLLCIPAFIVGMHSSLVFASPIISLTVTFCVLFGMFAINGAAGLWWDKIYPTSHGTAVAIWFPVSTVIVAFFTVRVIPRWLKVDRLNAVPGYVGSLIVAGLLPAVFGLTFGFLTIPYVPWQGMPLDQIKAVDWSGGPDLDAWNRGLEFHTSKMLNAVLTTGNLNEEISGMGMGGVEIDGEEVDGAAFADPDGNDLQFDPRIAIVAQDPASRIRPTFKLDSEDQETSFETWFEQQAKQLESIEKGGAAPATVSFDNLLRLNAMMENTGTLAVAATIHRKKDLAVRAWKAHRKLADFCQQPALRFPNFKRRAVFMAILGCNAR